MEGPIINDKPIVSDPPKRIEKHITELTDEERERILGKNKMARESYERCMREGLYHCKRDRCKEAREEKEKAEREREEAVVKERKTLRERSELLEKHARDMEAKQKKMQTDMDKLASLVAQLIPK
jgi:hypothetical protein